jgi:hypothetical protein
MKQIRISRIDKYARHIRISLKFVHYCLIAFPFYPKVTQNSYVMFGFNPMLSTNFPFSRGFLFTRISWIFLCSYQLGCIKTLWYNANISFFFVLSLSLGEYLVVVQFYNKSLLYMVCLGVSFFS